MPQWITPPTWTPNEIVTAQTLNKYTTDLIILSNATGSNVKTTVTTASLTTWVAKTGPKVTLVCGNHALVTITAQMRNTSNTRGAEIALFVNTVVPTTTCYIAFYSNSKATIASTITRAIYVAGLTNGATSKFEIRYRAVGGGTAYFLNRSIFVQPLK
jgi:hypothetical protein